MAKCLEICVDSVSSAIEAVNGGANRIELCMALSEGGLTPTLGLLTAVKKHISRPVEVFCMVRPRGGPMVYSAEEAEVILEDAVSLKKAGADGLVFGALDAEGRIDTDLCERVRKIVGDLPCTFHRAFDLIRDPLHGLEIVIKLGYQRILTSGGKATALEGCDVLAELVKAAGDRIIIMAGAGVKSSNVALIITRSRVSECHASARKIRTFGCEEEGGGARMGAGSDNVLMETCANEVKAIQAAMQTIS